MAQDTPKKAREKKMAAHQYVNVVSIKSPSKTGCKTRDKIGTQQIFSVILQLNAVLLTAVAKKIYPLIT